MKTKTEYSREYRKKHPDYHNNWYHSHDKTKNKLNANRYYSRKILFKDKKVIVGDDIRTGVCNLCRAVKGIDCKQTDMHHFNYHDNDPLKHTIELCVSCHAKIHHNNSREDEY